MKVKIGSFFLMLCFIGVFIVSASAQKKYQGLLWEISGNGIKGTSYLYGTMHVSNKIAFHLTDSFFIGLKACDIVALETNPQKWLIDMDRIGLFKEYMPQNYVSSSGFYKDAFNFYIPENRDLGGILAQDNQMINPLLNRLTMGSEDFSENTYLDLFLYQAGIKQGKKVVNLESYRRSLMLGQKALIPDKKEEEQEQIRSYKLSEMQKKGKNPYEILQDAYRRGNLNTVDSINNLTSGKRYRMLFITRRNIIMADNLDSILQKQKRVFTGIGAAHLPGDSGVIELLRYKGYKVRAVKGEKTKKGEKLWDKIDAKFVETPLDTFFITSDSMIKVKVPGFMIEMPGGDEQKDYLYSDMGNGAFYSITRLNIYGFLQNQDEAFLEKRMDSLFYESIPGDILSKEKFNRFGFTCYDIVNKTIRGDLQRYQILITPLEMIIFKVGGTGKFIKKMPQCDEFFNNIQFLKTPASEWSVFKSPKGGFNVDLPNYRERKGNALYNAKVGVYHELIQAYDAGKHNYFLVAQRPLFDFEYIEEDSFELRQLAVEFAKNYKYDVVSKELGFLASGHPFIKAKLNNEEKGELHLMFVLKGAQYYLLLTRSTDQSNLDRFFNSFKISLPKDNYSYVNYSDTALKFTVTTVKQSGDMFKPFIQRRYRGGYGYGSSNKKKKYEYDSEDHDFFNIQTGDVVVLNYYKYHDYYSVEDLEEYVERIKENLIDNDYKGLYVSDYKESNTADFKRSTFEVSDSFSHKKIYGQFVWKGGVVYTMKTKYSSKLGLSKFQKTFFETFAPFTDTTIGIDVFTNTGNYFFTQVNSGDSTKENQAFASMSNYVTFEKEHINEIIAVVDNFEFDDDNKKYQVDLIEELGSFSENGKEIIPYLSKKYIESAEERPDLQFACLHALADLETKDAILAFKKLILNDPPLTQGYEISNIFYRLDDSLELSTQLYPEIFELTEFDEYKVKVFQLLAIMVDSGLTDGSIYKKQFDLVLKEAKYALKRQQSKDQTGTKGYEYRNYFSSTYYQSNWSRHEVSYFCALLIPFKENVEAKKVLESMLKIEDEKLLLRIAIQQLKAGIEIPNDVLSKLSKEDRDVPILYEELKKLGKTDLIPSDRISQELFAKGRLFEYGFDDDKDSIILMEMREYTTNDGKAGKIFFFKSKEKDDEDWEMNFVAFHFTEKQKLKTKYVYSKKAISYNKDDKENLDKKMKEYIAWLKIKEHKRISDPTKSSYNYYDYDY